MAPDRGSWLAPVVGCPNEFSMPPGRFTAMSLPEDISGQVAAALGVDAPLELLGPVPGGDISRACHALAGDTDLFIKLNRAEAASMFAAEFDALEVLGERQALRVPRPICCGADREQAWLVMEHIDLRSGGDHAALGRGLAAMHRECDDRHGWPVDNFIGASPQANARSGNWCAFWWDCRLGPQLSLAIGAQDPHGLAGRAERLRRRMDALLEGRHPEPSLLHGDLWSGNFAFDAAGRPVIFDPACHFGDRETDIAMTELFGGFDGAFYAAYCEAWPLDAGYRRRRPLYQLYHLLNHLNLFGPAWLPRVTSVMDRLLAGA